MVKITDGNRIAILGVSGTGKTQLALRLCAKVKNRPVVVFDPFHHNKTWPVKAGDIVTDSTELLYRIVMYEKNIGKNLCVFVDEAGEFLQREKTFNRLATLTRQFGHDVYFIAQRAKMLTPAIRTNCNEIFCFLQSATDARMLADDFACPELETASDLKPLHYIHLDRQRKISRGRLHFSD